MVWTELSMSNENCCSGIDRINMVWTELSMSNENCCSGMDRINMVSEIGFRYWIINMDGGMCEISNFQRAIKTTVWDAQLEFSRVVITTIQV